MCTDSEKFFFSDKFTMSVVNDLKLLSSPGLGCRSAASGSRRSGSHHSHDHHNSGSGSDRDMEDDNDSSHHPSRHNRIEELDSSPRSLAGISGISQGGQAEERPKDPSVPGDQVPKGPVGQEALKPH